MNIIITGRTALLISSLLIILMAWLYMRHKKNQINVREDYEEDYPEEHTDS